jgi:hypothetical protein
VNEPSPSRPPTVGVYDRPPWWRTRRTWRIALPIAAALLSLVLYYFVFAR